MAKLRVGVLFGGRSGEHEISLLSAAAVLENLDREKYEVVPIGITKDGHWITHGERTLAILQEGKTVTSSAVLLPEPGWRGIVSLTARTHAGTLPIDVFFPVLHGTYGEDGTIQGLFELAGIPYVGCGVLASAVGMDKVVQKQLFQQQRIPTVPHLFFYRHTWDVAGESTRSRVEELFQYPVFVKPARLGSSVGVSKVENRRGLVRAVREALRYDEKVLVEEGILQPREFECGIIGSGATLDVSAVGEISVARAFYDYPAKYLDPRTERLVPADIPQRLSENIQQLTREAFHAIEGCALSRVDFLYDPKADALFVNEINTIPGLAPDMSFPKLWAASGVPLPVLLDRLIALALDRHRKQRRIERSFAPRKQATP